MSERREFVVYISSTLADLEAERGVALQAIAEFGAVKTSYRPSEERAIDLCTGDVRSCDLYIGILGQRYGWVPNGEDDPAAKSITEIEYETCVEAHHPPIPRLIFIKPTDAGIKGEHIDALANPKTAARMAMFLARTGKEQTPYFFRNLNELRAEIRIRVKEKADTYHRENASTELILTGGRPRKHQLTPVAVACVPGTDDTLLVEINKNGGTRFKAFELSPDLADYIAALERGGAVAQATCLLITPASLTRLAAPEAKKKVASALAREAVRNGRLFLLLSGVSQDQLPPEWDSGSVIQLATGQAPGSITTALDDLYRGLRTSLPDLSTEPRLAMPYLILAPKLDEIEALRNPDGKMFDGFADVDERKRRTDEFAAITDAVHKLAPQWPQDCYAETRYAWKCFGPNCVTAQDLVNRVVERINLAPAGARERRILQTAQLMPRRYELDDLLDDRYGSRKAVEMIRDQGCLILLDELALLHPQLRAAAEQLLGSGNTAVASVSPCDPAHTATAKLLGRFSYLQVGTLIQRFHQEHDPRCEIALNGIERLERWLRFAIPEMVASSNERDSDPDLVANAHKLLA